MKTKTIALAASLLLALVACGGDDEDPAAAATPSPLPEVTTAAPESQPPPSDAPSLAPPSQIPSSQPNPGPTAGKATPQEAAQAFYAAWGELDRRAASGFATQAAIDEAFGQTRAQADFVDCTEEEDHFACFFYYEGGGLGMTVRDSDAYGFIVTDINYVAD